VPLLLDPAPVLLPVPAAVLPLSPLLPPMPLEELEPRPLALEPFTLLLERLEGELFTLLLPRPEFAPAPLRVLVPDGVLLESGLLPMVLLPFTPSELVEPMPVLVPVAPLLLPRLPFNEDEVPSPLPAQSGGAVTPVTVVLAQSSVRCVAFGS
jgi:hypothetical protein